MKYFAHLSIFAVALGISLSAKAQTSEASQQPAAPSPAPSASSNSQPNPPAATIPQPIQSTAPNTTPNAAPKSIVKKKTVKTATPPSDHNKNITWQAAFRGGISHHDSGYKGGSKEVPAKVASGEFAAHLDLHLISEEKVSFDAQLRLMDSSAESKNLLQTALVKKNFGDFFFAGVGYSYLNLGGFENKLILMSPELLDQCSAYHKLYLPMSDSNHGPSATQMILGGTLGLFGKLSLQITDDVIPTDGDDPDTEPDYAYFNERKSQPVAIVEWIGDYKYWSPLVQFARYDLNHSTIFTVGNKIEAFNLLLYADYTVDQRAEKTGLPETSKYSISNIFVYGAYKTPWVTPYISYSKMDIIQPELDRVGNTSESKIDNDSSTINGGINITMFKDGFVPYLGYRQESLYVVTNARNPLESEKYSRASVLVGVRGAIH